MHTYWPTLLKGLFTQHAETLSLELQQLSEAERQVLFQAHKSDLQALRQACFFRASRPGDFNAPLPGQEMSFDLRYSRIAVLYQALQAHMQSVASWLKNERVSVYLAEDVYTLFVNLDTCWALLCDERSVSQLSKRLHDAPTSRHEQVWNETKQGMCRRPDAPEPWIYGISHALLLREQAWADEYISLIFEQHNQHSDGGFYVAVHEALQQRPTQTRWSAYLGKALNLEIWVYREYLATLPEAHVQALLSWVAPDTPALRHLEPLLYDEVQQFIQQVAQVSAWREYLLSLILQRLQAHERPARNLPWIKLWKSLKPTLVEIGAHQSSVLTLLHAPQSNVLQLALQMLKELVSNQVPIQQPEAFVSALLHHLQHPVQKIAKDSLSLLKLWSKRDPERATQILSGLPQQLLTPYQAVREQLYAWLKKQSLIPTARETLISLWADPQLNPLERESLLKHFPHLTDAPGLSLAGVEASPAEAPTPIAIPLPSVKAIGTLPSLKQAWAKALLQALDTDTEPQLLSLELSQVYASGPELPRLQSAEQILARFVSHASGQVSDLQFETLMQSVLQVSAPADLAHARQYLDPLLSVLSRLDRPQDHVDEWGHWRLPWRNGLVALLAWGWLHGGQVYAFQQPQISKHLFSKAVNPQASHVLNALACLRAGFPARLSQPDALAGWIEPSSLLMRLQSLPPDLMSECELEHALYALAPVSRETFWPQIQAASQHLPVLWQQALALACAPEPLALKVATGWIAELQQSPPDEVFLHTLLEPAPVLKVAAADQSLRLFCAALASRQSLSDYSPWPVLQKLPLKQLRCDLGVDYASIESLLSPLGAFDELGAQLVSEELSDQALVDLLNNAQELIQQAPVQDKRNLMALHEMSAEFYLLVQQALIAPQALQEPLSSCLLPDRQTAFELPLPHYRNLYPYLLNLQNTLQWMSPLSALPQHWSAMIPWLWPHPGQATRLFMAALINVAEAWGHFGGLTWREYRQLMNAYYRQKASDPQTPEPTVNWQEVVPRLDKNDLSLALLTLGQLAWVPLVDVLPLLIQPLTSKHSEQRQVILSVLQAGLETGRLRPEQVAEALSDLLQVTRKGFRYLQDALQQLSNQDLFGEYLVLHVLETYFSRLDTSAAPAVLSALLDLTYGLCQNLGRAISSPTACQALENLAQSKKKSVSRDKARLLLGLRSGAQTLLANALLGSLLQRLQNKEPAMCI